MFVQHIEEIITMYSINSVTIVGHLGADAEIRTMQNGDRVATMSIATDHS